MQHLASCFTKCGRSELVAASDSEICSCNEDNQIFPKFIKPNKLEFYGLPIKENVKRIGIRGYIDRGNLACKYGPQLVKRSSRRRGSGKRGWMEVLLF